MVTRSISEVVFQKPVRPGQIIKIYGDVLHIGTSSLTIRLEARRHSVYNGSQRNVCSIDMVFVRIDGDGEPVPIPTLPILSICNLSVVVVPSVVSNRKLSSPKA